MNRREQMAFELKEFERILLEAGLNEELSKVAILNIPTALRNDTKCDLARLGYVKAIRIVKEAVAEIESGATEKLNELVNKRLEKMRRNE